MSLASSSRQILPEDREFYSEQARLAKYAADRIEQSGFTSKLYVPPGGWRPTIDDERSKEPYPNQLLAAYRIFYEFYCNPNPCVMILLAALFQGGKTGVLQALTRLVMSNIDKLQNKWGISLITAMNDKSWLDQTRERILTELADQIYHLPTIGKLENNILTNVDNESFVKNILLIDDESRIGSKNVHRKGDLLRIIKTTSPYNTWKDRGIRYLFVDATDPACALNIATLKREGLATSIRLQLPPSYLSIEKLKRQGRLHKALDLKDKSNVESFYFEVNTLFEMSPLWHIIRMPSPRSGGYDKAKGHIESVFGTNYDIIEWNSEVKGNIDYDDEEYDEENQSEDINDQLNNHPEKPTLILIKNMFYAGKTLIDTYVGAMYDRSSERDDVTGQSFAGRASGHGRSEHTHVWTNLNGIDRLMGVWKDIIQMDDELDTVLPPANKQMNARMPHIQVVRPMGAENLVIRTSGEEITRQENLENREVINLPTKLKRENMLEAGPFNTTAAAIKVVNDYYVISKLKKPRESTSDYGGYHLNSRLLSWYRRKYNEIATSKDLKPIHKLTKFQFDSISITFGCSSRKGQPYLLYPVYPDINSPPSSVQWYVRYVKKEFTKFGRN